MSVFDPQAFLDAQQTEVNEKRPTLPAENPDSDDGMYTAVIGEITTQAGTIGKGDKAGQPWVSMVIPLRLQLPAAIQALGFQPEFTLTDRVFLDLTASGSIDNSKGKNRGQKSYREACECNKLGENFAWRTLQGKPVKVKVQHELYQDQIVEKVGGIFKA